MGRTASVRVELTVADQRQYGVELNLKRFGRLRLNVICHIPLFLGLAGVLALLPFRDILFRQEWVPMLFMVIIVVMAISNAAVSGFFYSDALEGQTHLRRPSDLTVTPDGLEWRNDVSSGTADWRGIMEVTRNDEYIFLLLDRSMAHLIPMRSFDSPDVAHKFFEAAFGYWRAAAQTDA